MAIFTAVATWLVAGTFLGTAFAVQVLAPRLGISYAAYDPADIRLTKEINQ